MNNSIIRVRHCILVLFLGFSKVVFAQSAVPQLGLVPEGSFQSYKVDSVNVANGNVVVRIPLVNLPQKGNLALSFSAIGNTGSPSASAMCSDEYIHCVFSYQGAGAIGITRDQSYVSVGYDQSTVVVTGDPWLTEQYKLTDTTGAEHPLFYDASNPNQMRTVDGSKFLFRSAASEPYKWSEVSPLPAGELLDSNGTSHSLDQENQVDQDVNGNSIHQDIDSSSRFWNYTDSVNRTFSDPIPPPTVSLYDGTLSPGSTEGCPNLSSQGANQPVVTSETWTVPGANGQVNYLICYANISVHTNYWDHNGQDYVGNTALECGDPNTPACNFDQTFLETHQVWGVIQSIVLPDKTYWGFLYDAADPNSSTAIAYGTLQKIILPTGGTISYQFEMEAACHWLLPVSTLAGQNAWLNMHVTNRTVTDGNGNSYQWVYHETGFSSDPNGRDTMYVTDPNGNDTKYEFVTTPVPGNCGNQYEGTRTIYQGSSSANKVLKRISTNYQFQQAPNTVGISTPPTVNAFPSQTTSTLDGDSASTSISITAYDNNSSLPFQAVGISCDFYLTCNHVATVALALGIPTQQTVTDGSGNVLKATGTTYAWQPEYGSNASSYRSANLLETPYIQTVSDAGGQRAKTTTMYDEASFVSYSESRAHPTTTTLWNNMGTDIQTHMGWNSDGTVDHLVDGKNHTSASYEYASQYFGLYPTAVTNAMGQKTSYTYELHSGRMTSMTDPNLQTTSVSYDSVGRLASESMPDTGSTTYCYNIPTASGQLTSPSGCTNSSSNSVLITTLRTTSDSIKKEADVDGLGRTIHTKVLSDLMGTDYTDITYDGLDRIKSISNPYRVTAEPSYGVTSYTYDGLGRVRLQCQPDNGTPNSGCSAGTSYLENSYSGSVVDIYDELRNHKQITNDAAGRLIKVLEPDPVSNIPSYETNYAYDGLDRLIQVDQWGGAHGTPGERQRTFTYDSLSRLVSAKNPESGRVCYGSASGDTCTPDYDENNNVRSRTDARGLVTYYAYDNLNRLISKSYSDSTPPVAYHYDESSVAWAPYALTNTKGKLSSAEVGGTNIYTKYAYGYDANGRLKGRVLNIPNAAGTGLSSAVGIMGNTYDLNGGTTSFDNGTGWYLTLARDNTGHVSGVTSNAGTTVPLNGANSNVVFTNGTYDAAGRPTSRVLGNNLTEFKSYDNRGRLYFGAQTNSSGAPYYWNVHFYANGNILDSSDSANGNWTYQYDHLNRLTAATNTQQNLTLSWGYDAFGNRMSQSASGSGSAPQVAFNMDSVNNNNRFDQASGIGYDDSGNVLLDNFGTNYTYDAEGRLSSSGSGGATKYLYDPEGNLIYESGPSGVQQRGYNLEGQVIYNYTPVAPTGPLILAFRAYIDGELIGSRQDSTFYWAGKDWLGTKRFESFGIGQFPVNATYSGPKYYTNLPFGDALNSIGGDPVHFTGKERDIESGLDYFGARHYSSSMGRFMRPDPSGLAHASLANPQSLNLYSYTLNNPLRFTDPYGLTPCDYGPSDQGGEDYEDADNDKECSDNGGTPIDYSETVNVSSNGTGDFSLSTVEAGSSSLIQTGQLDPTNNSGCGSQRIYSGLIGGANLGVAFGKSTEIGGGVSSLAATGVGVPAAAVLGVYGTVSTFGQALTGASQLYSAFTGNYGTPARIAQIGNILSGPIFGLGTLMEGGSLETAERNAGLESVYNGGTGLINSLAKDMGAFPLAMADHSTAYFGAFANLGQNCGPGH
jgi:RHS repeat-associated protein